MFSSVLCFLLRVCTWVFFLYKCSYHSEVCWLYLLNILIFCTLWKKANFISLCSAAYRYLLLYELSIFVTTCGLSYLTDDSNRGRCPEEKLSCTFQQPVNVKTALVPCSPPIYYHVERSPVLKSVVAGGVELNPFWFFIELFSYDEAPWHWPKEWWGTSVQRVLQFFH